MKALIKSGSVDKDFILKAKSKLIDNIKSFKTLPAVQSLMDTVGELAKSNVDVAADGETSSA